ncbi:hypothetical protein ACLOJK_004570 [Asimina triloba]
MGDGMMAGRWRGREGWEDGVTTWERREDLIMTSSLPDRDSNMEAPAGLSKRERKKGVRKVA